MVPLQDPNGDQDRCYHGKSILVSAFVRRMMQHDTQARWIFSYDDVGAFGFAGGHSEMLGLVAFSLIG